MDDTDQEAKPLDDVISKWIVGEKPQVFRHKPLNHPPLQPLIITLKCCPHVVDPALEHR